MLYIISFLPLAVVALSLFYVFKKPQDAKNLSRSVAVALLGFCLFAYFGNSIAKEGNYFWHCFGILTLYCVTLVPLVMHFASAIRQRRKLEADDKSN